MKELLLTLGHNSSAIMIENGNLSWGYETERITGVKSDSRFPQAVLNEKGLTDSLKGQIDLAYVTHWSPDGALSSNKEKHWQPHNFDGVPIVSLTPDMTHHDTHMWGAMAYAGPAFMYGPRTFCIVVDGFGSFGEHLSIYQIEAYRQPKLVKRYHGYGTSLGLWYQYATAFMGMKMHEDEYKLLGYEVHVRHDDAYMMDTHIQATALEWLDEMRKSVYGSKFDPVYNLTALDEVKQKVFRKLGDICQLFNIHRPELHYSRALLAYYVQGVLEEVMAHIVAQYPIDNLILAGGVAYNVKLNNVMLNTVQHLCVYPLAGDQGNAIGLYAASHPEFAFPLELTWGARKLRNVGEVQNLHYFDNPIMAWDFMRERLSDCNYVNLVRGGMEFGPRALCNTSTIAIPHPDVVKEINDMNERNTVMPMAPVMSYSQYVRAFEGTDKVWGSHMHMIVAMKYKNSEQPQAGIAHSYTYPIVRKTGRPQVVMPNDPIMNPLLNQYGPLINTSFNFHGLPIAYDMESIINNHRLQLARNPNINTVVLTNE